MEIYIEDSYNSRLCRVIESFDIGSISGRELYFKDPAFNKVCHLMAEGLSKEELILSLLKQINDGR